MHAIVSYPVVLRSGISASDNFTPLKFFKLYFSKTKNFKTTLYTQIWRLNLCQITKYHAFIFKFVEFMPHYARSPKEFSTFTHYTVLTVKYE